MISLLKIVPTLISAFVNSPVGKKKIPGFSQTIGEFVTSKTNNTANLGIIYGIYLNSQDPNSYWGHLFVFVSLIAWGLKDASNDRP